MSKSTKSSRSSATTTTATLADDIPKEEAPKSAAQIAKEAKAREDQARRDKQEADAKVVAEREEAAETQNTTDVDFQIDGSAFTIGDSGNRTVIVTRITTPKVVVKVTKSKGPSDAIRILRVAANDQSSRHRYRTEEIKTNDDQDGS